jgi:hypothetical protein
MNYYSTDKKQACPAFLFEVSEESDIRGDKFLDE